MTGVQTCALPICGFFGGNDAPLPIEEGKVDGNSVSFKAGNSTFSGTLKGDQIELQRMVDFGFRPASAPSTLSFPRRTCWSSLVISSGVNLSSHAFID